ncbi:MAG: ribosome silencing factor [Bacteroidota bacterium]
MPNASTKPTRPNAPAKQRATPTPTRTLVELAVDAMLDKKAADVTVLDLRGVSGVADFFVLATGTSDVQIKAIADGVRMGVKEATGELPWHREGYTSLVWVLLDYVDVVVHVFNEEKRAFYDLERLWGDAPRELVADGYERIAILDAPAA